MGTYTIKEYLYYYEVEEYLDDLGIVVVNFHNQDDVLKFNQLLLDLVSERKLTPVFKLKYPRPVNVLYYDKPLNEIDDISDETECKIINQYQKEVDGYCCLGYVHFDDLLKNYVPYYGREKTKEIIYFYEPYNSTLENNCLIEFLEDYSPVVGHQDILFPKSEIIKIFGDSPYNQTVPKLRKAITIINEQNNKITAQQAEIDRLTALVGATALNQSEPKKTDQDNALLALGAIMNVLKTNTIRNYSQTRLIDEIEQNFPDVIGLSESNLTKLFAKSKTYLEQKKQSKS